MDRVRFINSSVFALSYFKLQLLVSLKRDKESKMLGNGGDRDFCFYGGLSSVSNLYLGLTQQ